MITFWRPQDEHGYMSNFARYGFRTVRFDYKTNEHYYQSHKHEGTELEEQIVRCYTPKEAANLGRNNPIDIVKWNTRKLYVMRTGLLLKFTENWPLKDRLLDTQGQMLGEASPYDYYWGLGRQGSGKNWLGKLLMEVRNMIIDFDGIRCQRCSRHVAQDSKHVNFDSVPCV